MYICRSVMSMNVFTETENKMETFRTIFISSLEIINSLLAVINNAFLIKKTTFSKRAVNEVVVFFLPTNLRVCLSLVSPPSFCLRRNPHHTDPGILLQPLM